MAAAPRIIPPSQARLRRLISHGYFPAELPPPFTAEGYATSASEFAASWDDKKIRKFWTAPEHYSIPRYGDARRKLSIVNPINQLHVAHLVSENWVEIRKRLSRSKVTEFDPKIVLRGAGRAVIGVDFDGVARKRAEILSRYGRYVKTDIARFYASVYTHAIPWALLGKSHCKANHNTKPFKESFANKLDKAVAAGQEGQTIGIPIGPDTSRILSELIVVEVEEAIEGHIPDWGERSLRYVDDMLVGLKDSETPSKILSGLSIALYDFELELNASKTETLGLGIAHSPEWLHYIRTFQLKASPSRQREDIDSFFEQSIVLSDANPRDNVLKFAVKRAALFAVDPANMAHLIRWLLYSARRSPSCISFIAEHLSMMHTMPGVPHEEIKDYILQQLPLKAEAIHTEELAWLLFWAREIELKIPADSVASALRLRSSVVALLALDLQQLGLIEGKIDTSFWCSFAKTEGLRSEMWLAAYEATLKGWWSTKVDSKFASTHDFFGDLWSKNVEFYDPSRRARKPTTSPFALVHAGSLIEWGTYGGKY